MSNPERWHRFPPLPADIHERLAKLPNLLAQHKVELAYLFGSLAQREAGQDIDLALLTAADQPVFELRQLLTDALATERLDLIDLRRASPVLRFEIISTGRVIYAVNDETENRFEHATMHLYRDTAPMRRTQEMYVRERMKQWLSNETASPNG